MDKIVLEEHFVIPDFLDYLANAMPRVTKDEYDRVVAMLSDFGERRPSAMNGEGQRFELDKLTTSKLRQRLDWLDIEVVSLRDRRQLLQERSHG